MKIAKWIYYILLVVVNLAGSYAAFYLTIIYFLNVVVHNAFAGKAAYMTQGEKIDLMLEMSCYGLVVFLFITLVSFLISLMFRKRLAFDKGRVGKNSLIQVLSLAVGCVVAVCIALMITRR
jgi:uncharacterized membrane protein YhdT